MNPRLIIGTLPVANMGILTFEALLVCHIINQQNAHSTPIIGGCNRPEPLLTSCVPYLKLDAFSIQVNRADLEVDTDGGYERGCKAVLRETKKAAGFADARVAYEEEFYL